jgi:hypothetical protein
MGKEKILMINSEEKSFVDWIESLKNKKIIISNEGIGDTIICSNFANFFDTAVLRISDNINNNLFCQQLCELTNVPSFCLNRSHSHMQFSIAEKTIKQFDLHKHFNIKNNPEILKKVYTKNSEFFHSSEKKNK